MTSSRRTFVQSLVAASVGVAVAPAYLQASAWQRSTRTAASTWESKSFAPVLSFHMDRPYLDPSGSAMPFHPPTGTRSAQALAALTDAELRYHLWAS